MNTFLPFPDFKLSASVLDRSRLGKQRSECIQLLEGLDDPDLRVHVHPACIMWRGCRDALVAYGLAVCEEWIDRGYEDSCYGKILALLDSATMGVPTQANTCVPKWLGTPVFHASHRANLLNKDYGYYKQFGWTESPLMPYVWPLPDGFADPRLIR